MRLRSNSRLPNCSGALADIKIALTDAREELAAKDAEIAALKKQFQRSAETVEVKGFKYDKGQDGKPKGKPYCPVCEQRGQLHHLTRIAGKDFCPNCKAVYAMVASYL